LLPPPNPLLQRKHIPINSPKFGKNISYIKLNQFIPEHFDLEEIPTNSPVNITIDDKFDKPNELSAYYNSPQMLE
jgi:hypothetical protein